MTADNQPFKSEVVSGSSGGHTSEVASGSSGGHTSEVASGSSQHVRIFDTTLRDGEQSPGATLTLPEKLEIARHLEAMGVDVIEAGFPISSEGDFESVRAVAAEVEKSVVCGLARCTPKDIERASCFRRTWPSRRR